MKERERFEFHQKKLRILGEAHWQCEREGCGRRAVELAHRIARTKANRAYLERVWSLSREEAKEVIDSRENLAASCRQHNDYFNVGNDIEEWDLIIKEYHDNRERSKQRDKRVPETKWLVRHT